MTVHSLEIWKVGLAVALGAAIILSLRVRAPRRSVHPVELRRLVFGALALYAVGALAWFTHHPLLAGAVYAAGIVIAALAAWLSRGRDADEPRPDVDRTDAPDPGPYGPVDFDWPSFERDFRAYSEGRREPAGLD